CHGLAILLRELAAIPNRPTSSTLFIGQTLLTAEQHEDAIKEFDKIPVPTSPKDPGVHPQITDWSTLYASKTMNEHLRNSSRDEVRDYRFAQLNKARALRGAGNFAAAEKLLVDAVGTREKPGYATSSLDFRKELAYVYEAKGAATADVKAAGVE